MGIQATEIKIEDLGIINDNNKCRNAKKVFIDHEQRIIDYADSCISHLEKIYTHDDEHLDHACCELSKIIASCEVFLSILEDA